MNWWRELYDDLLAEMLLVREDQADVEETINFLVNKLGLREEARVFDQCCGIGALAVPLARRGYRVTGVDQAAGYIERAASDAAAAGVQIDLHTADAFEFRPSVPQDAAFNWWTSFGYSSDDRQNLRMLERAFESLVLGGAFALDTMNVAGVLRNLQPSVVRRRGELILLRESAIDLPSGVMRKRWTHFLPGGERRIRDSEVKIYLPHELGSLFKAAGFGDLEFYGSTRGEPIDIDSPRCIIVARRPA